MPTPEEQIASLKHEEQEGEVDVNLQEYKKRREEARRSPYPSVIVEVMSTPPPDFGARRDEAATEAAPRDAGKTVEKDDVTSDDVRRLEALFAMSAAKKSSSVDDPFYDALGEVRCDTCFLIPLASDIRLGVSRIRNPLSLTHLNISTFGTSLGIRQETNNLPNPAEHGAELGAPERPGLRRTDLNLH
jgi:hypothetical protein